MIASERGMLFVELKTTHVPLLKMEIAYAAPFMSMML